MNIPCEICDPGKRYDFLLLFDVSDGNPNGDPDAGNLPRLDPETMQGIVTDVCLKRKIRNFVDITKSPKADDLDMAPNGADNGYGIFVRDSGVALNTKLKAAAIEVGAPADKKKESAKGRAEMCRRYYDVRMFGGVLSTGDYNCGQVRGPMQLTFARSVSPIVPSDIAITRVAITREGEQKETEIGRKAQVPYGLYLGRGFYSPMLAVERDKNGTGVSEEDLELFWQAACQMFEHDRSASRGYMEMRGIYVFRHDNPLGNAHSGKLFGRLNARLRDGVEAPRRFEDYVVEVNDRDLPDGMTLIRLVE